MEFSTCLSYLKRVIFSSETIAPSTGTAGKSSKAIKQNLKSKTFVGTGENALRAQIRTALR